MKKAGAVLVLSLLACAQMAYALDKDSCTQQSEFGKKTVNTITDTTKSAVTGTGDIAKASVSDTIDAPKTAIQAVKDTANTALEGTDAALKTITGEDR